MSPHQVLTLPADRPRIRGAHYARPVSLIVAYRPSQEGVQSQTHLLLQEPCLSQSTAGLHDSSRRGGGETSTGTQRSRIGCPQLGRISRELLHIGCITPLRSSQKHSACAASGSGSVRVA